MKRTTSAEPVPLADAVAELIERSDLVDLHLRLRLAAWIDGYAAAELAHASDYEAGYLAAVAELKRADRDIVRELGRGRTRWVVRGEERTRQTYGRPHRDDYLGNGAA